jgi:hypothetical protein
VTAPYGLLAEFPSADALTAAARAATAAGYTRVEAFAPYPLPEAAAALGHRRSGVPLLTLIGGATGAASGFFMLYWVATTAYPINVGGRPLNSWPLWIPITFELTVLTAAATAFLAVLVLCGLPRFHHPLYASPLFARATTDGFYLCVEAADPKFDPDATRQFLHGLNPSAVEEVAR